MFPVSFGRRAQILCCAVLVTVALVSPAAAQTGMVKGKVVDAKGAPVEAAKVTVEFKDGIVRIYVVKTDKRGDFTQIGLAPGNYKVTAEKEKVGVQALDGRVRIGETLELSFKLTPGGGGGPSKEELARAVAIKKVFEEGVALSRTGDDDGALAKFAEAIAIVPSCAECYHNTGHAYAQKKEWDKSEQAYRKAIELRPDYVEAYNGLSQIFTLQKKFDEAQAASQKAAELAMAAGGTAGGGGTEAVYNVGVTAWNAGKAEEAKKAFEEVLKIDPKYANAHYQLAMCWVNLGKMPEAIASFEAYLQNAPDGQYAAQVKAMLTQLKK
jgi:tetratricopeptide (TPR) repeat protein